MLPDEETCWRAARTQDPRFDGWIYVGVTSTGIYCRPSCPARTPKRENVRFFSTAAGAQAAGLRACKRCRPDASPGSPEWDRRGDAVGRAVRQFNATIREVFAMSPTELRASVHREPDIAAGDDHVGSVALDLPYRRPYDGAALLAYLTRRAVPGIEEVREGAYTRSLRLPHGNGTVRLWPTETGHVRAGFALDDVRDLGSAVQRCRALLDLDSDPRAVSDALGEDPLLGPLRRQAPGMRVPGSVDGPELAVRAVLGQQVSLAAAATAAGRLVADHGTPLKRPLGEVTHAFPGCEALAALDVGMLRMPGSRARAVTGLAARLAFSELTLDAGADRDEARRRLLAVPGVGSWTAEYVAMRALHDPDAFPATDLGVHHALRRHGLDGRAAAAERRSTSWRPYRAYAVIHLWADLAAAAGQPAAAALAA